ncbi:malate/lactate/ureidoglycolate dehydrogenase [Roseomonas elaeocarpi]|uniref:Malate/lactate/ureidoglycolate dehydrogenase n=1 Tax=Roseomonas elaeocarpi TaxID=907779 RepID=A0ABV6JTG0_9PROT
MLITRNALEDFARRIFAAAGSGEDEAATVAADLVEANLKGHDSHGVGLIPGYLKAREGGHLAAGAHASFLRDDGPFGVADGGGGFGQVIGREVTDWAVRRAKETGIAVVAIRNCHHLGRIGAFGERAAAAGMVSLFFVNVRIGMTFYVAPHGGRDGRLQTNPVCITVPTGADKPPLVLDFATSAIAMGKVRVAYNAKKPVPGPVLIDAEGEPTTDPAVLFGPGVGTGGPHGALLPFGGHKGFGLSLMCEVLAGALGGGGANTSAECAAQGIRNNLLGFVIDPARLGDVATIQEEVAAVIEHVKASPTLPGGEVLVAGEPERRTMQQRLAGGIPVDDGTWAGIVAAAASVGVAPPG